MKRCTVVSLETSSSPTVSLRDLISQGSVALRASAPSDRDFLREVYESTRIEEFLAGGFGADMIRELLAQQFTMQDTYYRRHYPFGRFDIVVLGETDVGRLYHDWMSGEARVIDIALLPAYRGAGIGTQLMKAVVAEAARREMAVRLYVELNNPVRALYHRLGFEKIGENGVYEQMRRAAAPLDDAGVNPVVGLAGDATE
jgi:ribosomal protein S18 acetylase RimI-like enzyme